MVGYGGSARRGQTFIRHARTHQPHITRANERIGFFSSSWRMRACGDYLRVLFGKTKTTTIAPSTNTISGRRKERSIVTLHTKVDGLGGRGQRKESIRGTKDDDILSSHGLPYSRFLPTKIESETRFHVVKPRNLKGNRIT
jgi:hypothetical protein